MLQPAPPGEAPRNRGELTPLGIVAEGLQSGRDPLMLESHPQRAALVSIRGEQVDTADFRRATQPGEHIADVAIPIGGPQESRGGVGDRVENRLASANRRFETDHARIVQGGEIRHHELGGHRSYAALHALIHASHSRAIVWSIAAPSLREGIGRRPCCSSLPLLTLRRTLDAVVSIKSGLPMVKRPGWPIEVVKVVEVIEVIQGTLLPHLDHLDDLDILDHLDSMNASVIVRSRAAKADGVTPTRSRKSRTRCDWSK